MWRIFSLPYTTKTFWLTCFPKETSYKQTNYQHQLKSNEGTGCARQREIYAETGSLKAVVDSLAQELVAQTEKLG